jgi:hypothetical protein
MSNTTIIPKEEKAIDKTPDVNIRRERWFTKYKDILNGAPPELPPLRDINHRIPLIEESKRYYYHLPRCPAADVVDLLQQIPGYP